MIGALLSLAGGLWGRIAAVGALVLAVLGLLAKVRQSGREAERADAERRIAERQREADHARGTVDSAGDAELDRLRQRWTRR